MQHPTSAAVYAYEVYSRPMPAPAKSSRLAVRLSEDEDALIRRAADAEGATITDFTVSAAINHAHDVLMDRRAFTLNDIAWANFAAILDRPVTHKPRLAALLSEPSVFREG